MVLFALCNVAIRDMDDLSHALDGFSKAQWKVLGRELGLRSDLVDEINADYQQNGVGKCFSQVLVQWLRMEHDVAKFGSPTWYSLAIAVGRSGDSALADRILATKCRI